MIVDWNKTTLEDGTVFHFKNSLRPFIDIDKDGDYYFLDINEIKLYTLEDLRHEGLSFYEDENNEDFRGVKIDGKIKWVE